MLNVGDKAPEFSLQDQDGNTVTLADYKGQKVLLWFYPKASTPGCTAEGCNIRDNIDAFKGKNIAILGMSKDSVKRQKNFATKQEFPYPLLSDEPGDVVQAYGCWGRKKFMGREFDGILRTTFIVGNDGKLKAIMDKFKTKDHHTELLALLKTLDLS